MVLAPGGARGGPLGAEGGTGIPGAVGAIGLGAEGGAATPAGAGMEGAEGGRGGAGAFGEIAAEAIPTGAVVGPPTGIGAVTTTGLAAAMPTTGAVEPFGATGPESSACARRLIRTVSFFRGTVEVLTDGFGGS